MANGKTKPDRIVLNLSETPELHEKSRRMMDALVEGDANVYQHDARLGHVAQYEGRARPLAATPESLRHEISMFVRTVEARKDRKTGKVRTVEVHPPMEVVRDLLARSDWTFPVLDGIVAHPVMRPDGTLVSTPGYDPETRLYLDLDGGLIGLSVPDQPTETEVAEAVSILKEVLVDFPFAEEADRTAAIALFLTLLLRSMILGPTPIYVISAASPGTGKTLLVVSWGLALTGIEPPLTGETRDPDEFQKALVSLFMTQPEIIVVDNLSGRGDSGVLAMVATSGTFQGRILGKSEMTVLKVGAVIVLTANNPVLSHELARRSVAVRMVASVEQPWQREGFTHDDLRGFIKSRRPELIRAGLMLARAWVAKGRPRPEGRPLGSFETWWATIGGILSNAKVHGFLGNSQTFHQVVDQESATWSAFVEAWHSEHAYRMVRASELVQAALKAEAIEEGRSEKSTQVILGKALARMSDRIFSGVRIARGPVQAGLQYWKLVKVGDHVQGDVGDMGGHSVLPRREESSIPSLSYRKTTPNIPDIPLEGLDQGKDGKNSGLSDGNRNAMASEQGLF